MSRLETELKATSISKEVIETYNGRNIPRESFICCIKVVIRDAVLAFGHNRPVASVPAINTTMQRVLSCLALSIVYLCISMSQLFELPS